MSELCSGSCGSCQESCESRKPSKKELFEPTNPYSKIKKVIGVISGKGGVGKSFVTSFLSVLMRRRGYETAILDADITGPSIPKTFGIHRKVTGNEMGIFPGCSEKGTKIMSVNLLLDAEDTPVVWRGPIIAGTVKQFWSEVVWGDVDYMFVDMPPGTGDVPLTVFQSIPLDGVIIVTSPQELVTMIVSKAVNMARTMDIPVIGLIENYSYIECEHCGEKMSLFGESQVEKTAAKFQIPVIGKLPLSPSIAKAVDEEKIEDLEGDWLTKAADLLEKKFSTKEEERVHLGEPVKRIAVATDEEGNINQHYGSCSQFMIYEIGEGVEAGKKAIMVSEKGHEEIGEMLIEKNVNVLICGGIGSPALSMLLKAGIIVIPGQQGNIDVLVAAYLDGSLLESDSPTCSCHEKESESCDCRSNQD